MEKKFIQYVSDYSDLDLKYEGSIRKRVYKELYKNFVKSSRASKHLMRDGEIKRHLTDFYYSDLTYDIFNSDFINNEIRTYIETFVRYRINYSFKIYNREFNVHFYIKNDEKETIETCDIRFNYIVHLLFFLSTYAPKGCSKNLEIHYCPTDFNKYIPIDSIDVLDVKHVNSAFSSGCNQSSTIIIFREEEWFKVLIHELFHSLGLDFSSIHSILYTKKLSELLKIKSDYNIYEAYCEFWAMNINILFYTYHVLYKDIRFKDISFDDFYEKILVNLNIEKTFALVQVNKILMYMNLRYNMIIKNDEHNVMTRRMLYRENTNVLSYYILKTVLLVNDVQFYEWIIIHNKNLLAFKQDPHNIIHFVNFLIEHMGNDKMVYLVTKADNILGRLLKQCNKHIYYQDLSKTMRMTLLQFE